MAKGTNFFQPNVILVSRPLYAVRFRARAVYLFSYGISRAEFSLCRTCARKSLQVWPCKAKLCVYHVALPLTALVPAGRTHGQLDLLARRQHDERRGAVSVLPIPLSLGCPVPLPPCPSACGTESGDPKALVIDTGGGAPHSPSPCILPVPAHTRHNLALAECFCHEPRARQTGALTRGRWRKA